jgi:diguanylate cyclase
MKTNSNAVAAALAPLPTKEMIDALSAQIRLGQVDDCIEQLQAMVSPLQAAGATDLLAWCHAALGRGYQYRGDHHESLIAYNACIRLWENNPERVGESAVMLSMAAITVSRLGDASEALDFLRRALDLTPLLDDSIRAQCVWNNLGVVYSNLEDYVQAASAMETATRIAVKLNDPVAVSLSASNVIACKLEYGKQLHDQGDHAKAMGVLQAALQELDEGHAQKYGWENDDMLVATVCVATSHAYVILNDLDRARAEVDRGLAAARRSQRRMHETHLMLNLIAVERLSRNFHRAEIFAPQAMDYAREVNDPGLIARCHMETSLLYEDEGRFQDALKHYKHFHMQSEANLRAVSDARAQSLTVRLGNEVNKLEAELFRLRTAELELDVRNLSTEAEELGKAANEDSLTGLGNRRHFEKNLAGLRAGNAGARPVVVAIGDVDHFKRVNDTYSHAVGDAVLQQIGSLFRAQCRPQDVVARFGGEEFVIAFADLPLDQAHKVADRLRLAIEQHDWSTIHPDLKVTISIGLANYAADSSFAAAFAQADRALYAAKNGGRNRVCIAGE